MNKGWFILFILMGFKPALAGQGVLSREDLDLQIALESQYHSKISQILPDLRFMVSVHLVEHPQVKLDLLGGFAPLRDRSDSIQNQIKQVDLVSEEPVDLKMISSLIQLPETKIKTIKVDFPRKFQNPSSSTKEQTPGSKDSSAFPSWIWMVLAASVGLIAAFLMMGLSRIKSSIANLAEPISKGFENLGSIENSGLGAVTEKKETPSLQFAGERKQTYQPNQLKAFFSECYWTSRDAEASALVRAYPEMKVYQELRFGHRYLDYLKQVRPGSLEFLNDPYFLNPSPIFFELSVADTTLKLIPFASQMRFEAKNPGVVELMRIQTEDLVLPEIRGVQSELRILKQAIRIRFRDVEEENSVLKSGDFTEEMKLKLPSLYRLNELPEESFQSVVAQLTVSEIARCWVGPDWLLNSIEARLPERKKVLLKDLQQKVSPNRDHPAFSKLLELCDEVWSSPGEVKKAA